MARKTARTHAQGDESRRCILDVTLDIASRLGYDGTTVARVTEAAGLPASSVYWHFKNKDELLAEVLAHSYRQWRVLAPSWDDDAADGPRLERIRLQLDKVAVGLSAQPDYWRLGLMLALEKRPTEPAARRRFLELREESLARMSGWWTRVLEQDELTAHPEVPRILAQLTLAGMDGLFIAWQGQGRLDLDPVVAGIARGLDAAAGRLLAAPPSTSSANSALAGARTTRRGTPARAS